ncbi:unnamed protein product [Linum tenue]|uniref:non-specific serine/threonine protein kinase n=1 Tax=Linum tenue TaxID=586396 RepID=A0AAV0RDJ3_9ROSI|nr:unnamed protein product [Linum tenue]
MESATGGFKQVLGSGASSTVYKGVLGERSGGNVAVKVLDKLPERDGHDVREFATEVKIIGGTNHKNLVKLVGYCNEGQHRLLVYEFMSNGSLADSLFGGGAFPRPNWYTRTQIAYSVARGLVYLHDECSTQIIHCDIKPQNILLDEGMIARISDFGLSKLMKADQTRTTTAIRGTKGYLAPEWFRNVPVTAKVDVHSFGIVLLELVCCRKNFLLDFDKEEEMVLVDWAYDCYSRGKLYKLVEKDVEAMEDLKKVERFVKVALWCIQEDPSLRPGMKKVVHMLEGAVPVSEPPDRSGWAMRWNTQAIQPPNICTSVRGLFGGGACGVNSYCHMESGREENAASPSCKCPPRYVFMDPSDESKGCMKNFASHDCRAESNGSGDDQFDIMEIPSTNWPDFFYDQLESQTEGMCRQACLSDCLCDVAIFFGGFCWKKRMPLTNGRMEEGASVKALIKVGRSNSSSLAYPRKKDESSLKLTGGLLIGSSVFLNLLLLSTTLLFFSWWRRNNKRGQLHPTSSVNLLSFSYSQLESATGGFKEVLGRGASATVYKGILQNVGETITIAVKKMDKLWGVEEGEDDNREFTTEVKVIAGTNHKNLVKLVGVCSEGKNHLLVYEYMSNGSLASLLFKADPRPNWYTRAQIAISVARGLVYLHEECSTQIIHCDIKPQNILLDESLTAKISDFGLAKLLKVEQTRTMTAIRGTKGYVAPEWFRNMAITTKVDVYSFGVVLLELVCCRRGFEMEGYEEEEMVLVDWAHECYGDRMVGRLVEKDEEAMKDLVKVERFVKIGLWCVQEDPCLRPEMKKVVHMLEGAVEVSVPPSPASYINTV